jgi:hypothetical protein
MKTAIGHPQIFYTVYKKKSSQSSPSSPPHFQVVGAFSDIRDAVQAILTAYKRCGNPAVSYGIESSPTKPKHWLHPSKYRR